MKKLKSTLAISCAALAITLTLNSAPAFGQNSLDTGNVLNKYTKEKTLSSLSNKNKSSDNLSSITIFSESNNTENSHNLFISDEQTSIMIRQNDNITEYSTDNGETWLTELPEKYKNNLNNFPTASVNLDKGIINDENCFFTFGDNNDTFQVRFNSGKIEYSIDGGETWSTENPKILDDLSMDIKIEVFNADSENTNEIFNLIPDASDV